MPGQERLDFEGQYQGRLIRAGDFGINFKDKKDKNAVFLTLVPNGGRMGWGRFK
jgi:hypothetical protein